MDELNEVKSEVIIREMEIKDEDQVLRMTLDGIWFFALRRIRVSALKSNTFIAFLFVIFAISYMYLTNIYIASGIAFVLVPFVTYVCMWQYFVRVSFPQDKSTLDMRNNIYDYWTRPNIPQMKLWVAEVDSRVVGSVSIRPANIVGLPSDPVANALIPDKDTAILERMFVDDSCRGTGVGKKLMDHAERFCKEHRFTKLTLGTSHVQHEAMKFYAKCGFEVESVIDIVLGTIRVYNYSKSL